MTFRSKLLLFGVLLISILAVPGIYMEAQRPWELLKTRIDQARLFLTGWSLAFEEEELMQMNVFALDMVDALQDTIKLEQFERNYEQWAPSQGFEMLIQEGRLLSEKEVLAALKANELEFDNFNYDRLVYWYGFWQKELDARPGLEAIFRKYKTILRRAIAEAEAGDFTVGTMYLTVDRGKSEEGYFAKHVAFLLEGAHWTSGVYPTEHYSLEESDAYYWRESYDRASGGTDGFFHNTVADPDNFYLPRFTHDEWGVWFNCWIGKKMNIPGRGTVYNSFTLDFDAAEIRQLMEHVAIVFCVVSIVLGLILYLAIRHFSNWLSRPVNALSEGASAVMRGDYSYAVPQFGKGKQDEFAQLTTAFNQMVDWVRERVNLKDTLTKVLSEELAEHAARDGMLLGGQQAECTVIFTDFAGFATLTRSMPAAEVVEALNEYFSLLIPIIKEHGGFPDKYIGDAIVAIFGAPVRFDDHAERAVRCAIALQQAMRRINAIRRKHSKLVFEMRIGLNTGEVVVGAIGCDMKLEYTAIGESANLANRIESRCQIGHILMSEHTFEKVQRNRELMEQIEAVPILEKVKGYAEPIKTYAIYVDEQRFEKNAEAKDARDFYVVSQGVSKKYDF